MREDEQRATTMSFEPEVPSLLVGLGAFGTRVADRIAKERDDARGRSGGEDRVPFARLSFGANAPADQVAAEVLREARACLAHRRMVRARDRREAEGLTRLHVFVVGHLVEAPLRERLGDVLAAIETRLLSELGPIFEAFRTGAQRNLLILPILAMPHPAAHADGEEVARVVRALGERVAATEARRRAVAQLFLIEDVAEFSVLSDEEVADCVRNFVTLLLYSASAVPRVSTLLYGEQPAEPLATFVCAAAELPRRRLEAYAHDRLALEVIEGVLEEGREEIALEEIDAIEEVELASLDAPRDADRDVLALLERYAPAIDRDPEPTWWERSEDIRARYGPDPGDPGSDEAQAPPDPPVGWALTRMREIERTWRMLQRRRFDDMIAKEREEMLAARETLVERIQKRVDTSLFGDPSPEAFRRTGTLVRRFERAVSLRLEDALVDRDRALPVPPPSFDTFREAHGRFLDEARRRPDLARLVAFALLSIAAFIVLGPPLLRALADALGVAPTDWQSPWLRERAWVTSGLLALGGVGGGLFVHYRRRHLALREAFHEMWLTLERTVTGSRDSVLEYFASRLRLAREVARVEALLAVRATVLGDAERFTLIDRAARRARSRLLESLRENGVRRTPDGQEDASGLLGVGSQSLIESLLPPETPRFVDRLCPPDARDARVRDALGTLARELRYDRRWREETPFTDLDALESAVSAHAAPLANWDPFETPESADAVCRHLAAFARRQARSLHVALNFTGHEALDPTGISEAASGEVVAPPGAYEELKRLLEEEGAAGRVRIPVIRGHERDRAFYVLALGDIHAEAVASLRARPPAPTTLPRFEVEGTVGATEEP